MSLPHATPHQQRVNRLLQMQEAERIAKDGAAFQEQLNQKPPRDMSKPEYLKFKANMLRALRGIAPR
jgi:hypothetical protein